MTSKRRRQIEREIIKHIRHVGGFITFWATETQSRAIVLTAMIKRGKIKTTPMEFPWTSAKVKGRV